MTLEATLLEIYSSVFQNEKKPDWAVTKNSNKTEIIHPPIPFVGKNYNNLKILMYASAENLTYYTEHGNIVNYLDEDLIAINRHRYCFDNYSENRFFPYVHIEPVNNGALMLIVAYIAKVLKEKEFSSPFELAENITIANFCKYSIQSTSKNYDYTNNKRLLESSIKYIENDLKVLKPEIIILPKTIFHQKTFRNFILNTLPSTTVLPLIQITTTTINTYIHKKYKEKNKTKLFEWLVDWHEKLPYYGAIKGKIKDNYYSIYTYLDEIINNMTTPHNMP